MPLKANKGVSKQFFIIFINNELIYLIDRKNIRFSIIKTINLNKKYIPLYKIILLYSNYYLGLYTIYIFLNIYPLRQIICF